MLGWMFDTWLVALKQTWEGGTMGTHEPTLQLQSSTRHKDTYLVGGDWNHGLLWLSIQLGMDKSSQLTNSIIFQRGRYTANEVVMDITMKIWWNVIGIYPSQLVIHPMWTHVNWWGCDISCSSWHCWWAQSLYPPKSSHSSKSRCWLIRYRC